MEEKKEEIETIPVTKDRAQKEFALRSLRDITNQYGTEGYQFQLEPHAKSVCSSFAYPETLRTAKHPVQDFWVYDGAYPGLTDRGSVKTSRYQVLPEKRITEQDCVEWNRVGSKKGWMFNGPPQQKGPGFSGENVPTHTSDGFISRIRDNRERPLERSEEKQRLATREMPAIDIENNARGIGLSGPGKGNGGMSGGYREINQERLAQLPIPMAKYNWTGTRLTGTGREDQGGGNVGSGAGGFRAGYNSRYNFRPAYPIRKTTGISRLT